MVTQLTSWRRSSSSFPVLSWQQFVDHVRSKVNPLAGDDHMKLLVQQLQLSGEVCMYSECPDTLQLLIQIFF